jgi:hypothetical protein
VPQNETRIFEPARVQQAAARAAILAELVEDSDLAFLVRERTFLLDLVAKFVDQDECEYDGNGLCEVHMHLTQGTKCPHDEARYVLEVNGWTR